MQEKVVYFNLSGVPEEDSHCDYHSVLIVNSKYVFELQRRNGLTGKVIYLMEKKKKLLVSPINSIWYIV